MRCSIIVCTRNRAAALAETLCAFRAVRVPAGMDAELIVVDNGSTDDTTAVVKAASAGDIPIRYLFEPRTGKSRAQNRALTGSRGEALLFTDDDVRPPADWLELMAPPILERRCDAIAGCVHLAAEMERPWLTLLHRLWLAEYRALSAESPELVGANMSLHRSVFERAGLFDEELGPGASGFGEETLLWWQMQELGLRIHGEPRSVVMHHPGVSRLQRAHWLTGAVKRGRSNAYLAHHWQHCAVTRPRARAAWIQFKLLLRRCTRPPGQPEDEGCPAWEMSYIAQIAELRQWLTESQRPRNYERRGIHSGAQSAGDSLNSARAEMLDLVPARATKPGS